MKDAYYFSHDTNSRNDPKISALLHEYGPEGYGVFWMVIETLAEQSNYKLKKFNKLYEGLASQFRVEVGRLRSIIEALLQDYELLLQDENYIWSESLLRRMETKEAKKKQKIEAGRKGGLKSGISRSKRSSASIKTKQNEAVLEANEPKESKVKESIYKYIVEYLNQKTSSSYKSSSKKTQSLIDARLNDGFDEHDFVKVIDIKCSQWFKTDMSKYLRPETLFGTKFEGYLNEKPILQVVNGDMQYRDLSNYEP